MGKNICRALVFFAVTGMVWAGTITVTSPRFGAKLCHGRNYPITWTSSGKVGRVMVRLMSGRIAAANLSLSTENDGRFDFAVVNTIPEGDYVIEVQSLDRSTKGQSETFRVNSCILTPAPPPPLEVIPQIIITSPHPNSALCVGQYLYVKWRAVGRMPAVVDITLHQPDCSGHGIYLTTANASAGQQFVRIPPTVRPSASQPVHIRVGEFRSPTFGCVKLNFLHCKNIITEPNSGTIWRRGESAVVRWNCIDREGNNTVNIFLETEANVTRSGFRGFTILLACNRPNTGEASITVPAGLAPGRYLVSVTTPDPQCVWYFGTMSEPFQITVR